MLIKVKVLPNSNKEEVVQIEKDRFQVAVKEKAKEGRANQKMIELIAKHLKISPKRIKIIKGAKKPNKILKIFK